MVLIFLIAGVIYIYLTGRQGPAAPKAKTDKNTSDSVIKPAKPAANAAEGVALESFITPIKAGDNDSLQIRTNPTSTCSITVTYSGGGVSHDSGLAPKKADDYGFVTWTWTVDPSAPAGALAAKATCVYNGRTGVAVANIQVTR